MYNHILHIKFYLKDKRFTKILHCYILKLKSKKADFAFFNSNRASPRGWLLDGRRRYSDASRGMLVISRVSSGKLAPGIRYSRLSCPSPALFLVFSSRRSRIYRPSRRKPSFSRIRSQPEPRPFPSPILSLPLPPPALNHLPYTMDKHVHVSRKCKTSV